jgi:hypothetical protein
VRQVAILCHLLIRHIMTLHEDHPRTDERLTFVIAGILQVRNGGVLDPRPVTGHLWISARPPTILLQQEDPTIHAADTPRQPPKDIHPSPMRRRLYHKVPWEALREPTNLPIVLA